MPTPPPVSSLDDIARAAARLRVGGVVAFPTETVYGLGADAFNAAAVDRVFALKGRPRNNPLIVHVSGPEMARRVAREWSPRADALARRFWPGPLSILVPRSAALPEAVTAGADLVAVRCPNHPVTLALLFEFGGPLIGPSANLSGQVSPTTAAHVRESFREPDVLVLEGGACEAGIESTVVDVTSVRPRVLRPGIIGAAAIADAIGCEVESAGGTGDSAEAKPLLSPGLLERHYAPRTPAHVVDESNLARVLTRFDRAVVISHREPVVPPPHRLIVMPKGPEEYAAALYAALRDADRVGATVILVDRPPGSEAPDGGEGAVWEAVADRLARATTPLG